MAQMTIQSEEADLLRSVVEYYLSELGVEIKHTDERAFREKLKDKREMLEGLRSRLESIEH